MANVEQQTAIDILNQTTNSRTTWFIFAAVRDTPAGQLATLEYSRFQDGITPAGAADSLVVTFRDAAGNTIRTQDITPNQAGPLVLNFYLTNTGLVAGSPRAGLVYVDLRAIKTTGGPLATYDISTTAAPNNPPSGFAVNGLDRGVIRGTTTATFKHSNVAVGGAKPSVFAYTSPVGSDGGDTVYQSVTMAHPLYSILSSPTHQLRRVDTDAVVPGSTTAQTTPTPGTGLVFSAQFPRVIDNRLPAGITELKGNFNEPAITTPLGILGQYGILSYTPDNISADPRLTRTPLFQLDDNTFGTPPLIKDRPDHKRLTSQQGFLGSRTVNARGEGVNGVTYSIALTPVKPGTPVSQTGLVTNTQGGQDGWSPTLTPWSSSLPGGQWNKAVTTTAPSDITGAAYTLQAPGTSTAYFLVARDLNIELRVGANHEPGLGGRHFTAGMALVANAYLINSATSKRIPASEFQNAQCAVVRGSNPLNLANGTGTAYQYLSTAGVWTDWPRGTAQDTFPLDISPADPDVIEHRFATDSTWGTRDVRVAVQVEYEGVIYSATLVTINVGQENIHDGYKFDGAGFVGFPVK